MATDTIQSNGRQRVTLIFIDAGRPTDPPLIHRIRALLKHSGRRLGLKCVGNTVTQAQPMTPQQAQVDTRRRVAEQLARLAIGNGRTRGPAMRRVQDRRDGIRRTGVAGIVTAGLVVAPLPTPPGNFIGSSGMTERQFWRRDRIICRKGVVQK
jgi:hypothetical protein